MRFSVFLVGHSTGPDNDAMVMDGLVDHAMRAEALGYDAVFLPEQHFTGRAPMGSDPFMFACYLAGGLRRVFFGVSEADLALHHPARFVERVNLLDQLTKGRLLIGLGPATPETALGFGIRSEASSRLADQNLAVAERLWAKSAEDEPVVFEAGPYSGAIMQRIVPAPYRRPHARLMHAALDEASLRRAAERGRPALLAAGSSTTLALYRDLLLSAGHSGDVTQDCLGWTSLAFPYVHLAETDEQAREELQEILDGWRSASEPDLRSEAWIAANCLWGSPRRVVEALAPYAGFGNVLLGFTAGPIEPRRLRMANRAMKLFATEVAPAFRQN